MRAILLLLSVLLTAGCTTNVESEIKSSGKLLFSIRITQGAFIGVSKEANGLFFYLQDSGEIIGDRMQRGKPTDIIYYGSAEILQQIEEIGFEPFDFDAELKKVDDAVLEEARHGKKMQMFMRTLDGAEYEIRYVFGDVDYTLRTWNPIQDMESHASRSPKIAKLKALIDLFGLQYGRAKFGQRG
jgi:hypothetical protein